MRESRNYYIRSCAHEDVDIRFVEEAVDALKQKNYKLSLANNKNRNIIIYTVLFLPTSIFESYDATDNYLTDIRNISSSFT